MNNLFLFITATSIEREAFENAFEVEESRIMNDINYNIGKIGLYDAAHVHLAAHGSIGSDAVYIAGELIREIKPAGVIMVGIAFGANNQSQKIGDVLVSQKILSYNREKIRKNDSEYKESVKDAGTQLTKVFSNKRKWKHYINATEVSTVHIGAMLTGSKLIDNQYFKEKLLSDFNTFLPIGGEMEGHAVSSMCNLHGVDEWIIVKGIGDFGYDKDENKDANQRIAAEAAVSYCHYIFSQNFVFTNLLEHTTNKQDNQYSGIVSILNDKGNSVGTGFFISPHHLLTCNYVFDMAKDVLGSIRIRHISSWNIDVATIVAQDKETDLVLLHSEIETPNYLPIISTGEKGDKLHTIGFPGDTKVGIHADFCFQGTVDNGKLIQLGDANAITSGFSGSPAINENDEIIGMIAYLPNNKSSRMIDLAFAIPSKTISDVFGEYIVKSDLSVNRTIYNKIDFIKSIKNDLWGLERKQRVFFSWLCAVRALPFLGVHGDLNFWEENNRMKHLFDVFNALDVVIKSPPLRSLYGINAANAKAAAKTANDTTIKAVADTIRATVRTAARAADADNAKADSIVNNDSLTLKAAIEAARVYGTKEFDTDFQSIILNDIECIKAEAYYKLNNDISLYGAVWERFQAMLKANDCSYWSILYESIFKNSFQVDKESLDRRLSVPKEIQEQGAKAVAKYMTQLEKKYKVFISSTYIDLEEERAAVVEGIIKLGHVPVGMEFFLANNGSPWNQIKRAIDESDYFVLVVGNRYGSMRDEGNSYVESEFKYAVEKGIPVLAFVHEDTKSRSLDESSTDKNSLLEEFKKEIINSRLVMYWGSAEQLSMKVNAALTEAFKRKKLNHSENDLFTNCTTIEELCKEAIIHLSKTVNTGYNQIILAAKSSSRGTVGLFVCADAIVQSKPKYQVVSDNYLTAMDKSIIAKAFHDGKAINVANVHNYPAYLDKVPETRSELATPIIYDTNVWGVINSESDVADYYTYDIEQKVKYIGDAIAIRLADLGHDLNSSENELPYISVTPNNTDDLSLNDREASLSLTRHLEQLANRDSNSLLLWNSWQIEKTEYAMKLQAVGQNYGNYTLHGEQHSVGIVANIERLLGADRIILLSPTDTWLILTCAYRHVIVEHPKEKANTSEYGQREEASIHVVPRRLRLLVGDIVHCRNASWEELYDRLPRVCNGFNTDDAHPRFVAALLQIGDLLDVDSKRSDLRDLSASPATDELSLVHQFWNYSICEIHVAPEKIHIIVRYSKNVTETFVQQYLDRIDNGKELKNAAILDVYELASRVESEFVQFVDEWMTRIENGLQKIAMSWNDIAPNDIPGGVPAIGRLDIYQDENKINRDDYRRRRLTSPEGTRETGQPINNVSCAVYSNDERCILSIFGDNTVCEWDRESGQLLHIFEGHSSFVRSVAYSDDGQHVLSASDDNTIREWNRKTGACRYVFEGHSSCLRSAVYSTDGRRILSASRDSTIREWDRESGNLLRVFEGHSASVRSAVYSADGRCVLSASGDKTIREWDRETGVCLRIIKGHKAYVYDAVYSADGRRVLSASGDKTIREWDRETGACLRVYKEHNSAVNCAVYSADGQHVLSASKDKSIREWDWETGTCQQVFKGHRLAVRSVMYSADGLRILSVSKDKTVREWDRKTCTCLHVFGGNSEETAAILTENETAANNVVENIDDGYLVVFSEEESLLFLERRTQFPPDDATKALAKQLGYVPLALELAASYMIASGIGYAEYLKLLEKHEVSLSDQSHSSDNEQIVAIVWKASMERISEAAKQFLYMCAYLAPDSLTKQICLDFGIKYFQLIRDELSSDLESDLIITELTEFSILKREENSRYSLHPLVQQAIRRSIGDEKFFLALDLDIIMGCIPKDYVSSEDYRNFDLLAEHAASIIGFAEEAFMDDFKMLKVIEKGYYWIARGYVAQSKYTIALPYLTRSASICEKIYGSDQQETAGAYNSLGRIYYDIDELEKAQELYQKAFDIKHKLLGVDHPDMAIIYNNLGDLHRKYDNNETALNFYEKALQIREKTLGLEHPYTATSIDKIACLYRDKYKDCFEKALELHKKSYKIRIKALGAEYPDVAWSYHNMSICYLIVRHYKKALQLSFLGYSIRLDSLGENHRDTKKSYDVLLQIYIANGGKEDNFQTWLTDTLTIDNSDFYISEEESFDDLLISFAKAVLDAEYQKAYELLPELKVADAERYQTLEDDFQFLFDPLSDPDESLDVKQERWAKSKEYLKQKVSLWYLLTKGIVDEQPVSEEESIPEQPQDLNNETKASTQLDEPAQGRGKRHPGEIGETLEKKVLALLRELFYEHEISGPELEQLRQQLKGYQFGHDISLEYKDKAGSPCVCLIECKDTDVDIYQVSGKLEQARDLKYGGKIHHWIVISPNGKIANDLGSGRVKSWNAENRFEPIENLQIWSRDNMVEEFFALLPEVHEHYYGKDKTVFPDKWSENGEERNGILKKWKEKLAPANPLPKAWKDYFLDPSKLFTFSESCEQDKEDAFDYDDLYKNRVHIRCRDEFNNPVDYGVTKRADYRKSTNPKGNSPFLRRHR